MQKNNPKSSSFVTWNGTQAVIWKIENETYSFVNDRITMTDK